MVCGQGCLYLIHRRGRTFGGLVLQGQPDVFSGRNIFDDLCTEEGTVAGKAIFEGGFKFVSYEVRK